MSYQFLLKQILSQEKHSILGYTDNVVTLKLGYNRVKTRVTPQIEAQVDAILDQWFGSDIQQTQAPIEQPQINNDSNNGGNNYWEPQATTLPSTLDSPINSNRSNTPLGGYSDDEDVVID